MRNSRSKKRSATGETETDTGLDDLCMELRGVCPPEALLDSIVRTVGDRFLGFEALALASIRERSRHTAVLERLPVISGVAETSEAKVGLARAWIRCWWNHGFWLSSMPVAWWNASTRRGHEHPRTQGKFQCYE